MISKRAHSTTEYVFLISCIVMGLVAMQRYLTRANQGKLKAEADQIGFQYEAGSDKWDIYTHQCATRRESIDENGTSNSELLTDEKIRRWSN